jgi:hypothetical protein
MAKQRSTGKNSVKKLQAKQNDSLQPREHRARKLRINPHFVAFVHQRPIRNFPGRCLEHGYGLLARVQITS